MCINGLNNVLYLASKATSDGYRLVAKHTNDCVPSSPCTLLDRIDRVFLDFNNENFQEKLTYLDEILLEPFKKHYIKNYQPKLKYKSFKKIVEAVHEKQFLTPTNRLKLTLRLVFAANSNNMDLEYLALKSLSELLKYSDLERNIEFIANILKSDDSMVIKIKANPQLSKNWFNQDNLLIHFFGDDQSDQSNVFTDREYNQISIISDYEIIQIINNLTKKIGPLVNEETPFINTSYQLGY